MSLYSMIENIDVNVGRILAELDRLGQRGNTLVIFATDQGVQDRGAPNPRNTDRRPEHNSAFDPKHTVFCMMRYPPLSKAHQSHALTGMVDVAPTILDICGLPPIDSMDGRSLRPLLRGETTWKDDRSLIIHCPRTRYRAKWENASLKTQRWRLVGGDQLYEIANDRDQLNNVADQYPEVVADLSSKYNRFWDTLPPASDLLSRHLLGAPEAPEVKLNCMDWYVGDHPWGQGNLRTKNANGLWPVDIIQDGKYRFELRVYPREAAEPIGAVSASIRVGSEFKVSNLSPEADKAVFTLNLKEGLYDMETSFKVARGSGEWTRRGAFFVYVTYLGTN